MVQLIADLQGTFLVKFDLDEIGALRSYNEIRRALFQKGHFFKKPMVSPSQGDNHWEYFHRHALVFIVITVSQLRCSNTNERHIPARVRQFLLTRYARSIEELGMDPNGVPDNFDFLLSGVIDSFEYSRWSARSKTNSVFNSTWPLWMRNKSQSWATVTVRRGKIRRQIYPPTSQRKYGGRFLRR